MKWRGQGILTAIVLICAGAYAVQWRSNMRLVDEIEGHGLPLAPYIRPVAEFVDDAGIFPQPGEVALPAPPQNGVISSVTLGEKGTLKFMLTTWTIFDGHVSFTMAPEVNVGALLPAANRLHYSCIEVQPERYASTVCHGMTTQQTIDAANETAFAEWEADLDRIDQREAEAQSMASVRNECDRIARLARDEVLDCVTRIDSKLGEQLEQRIVEAFETRRLRPEVMAQSPELLDQFNAQCTQSWEAITGMIRAGARLVEECLPAE